MNIENLSVNANSLEKAGKKIISYAKNEENQNCEDISWLSHRKVKEYLK